MDELYDQTLSNMEASHTVLASRVNQPHAVTFGSGFVFRYVERDVHQALVQKLARVISGLHAARLLLAHGFVRPGIRSKPTDQHYFFSRDQRYPAEKKR